MILSTHCNRLPEIGPSRFQEVFVFDAGQVVEQGSPQQLLKQVAMLGKATTLYKCYMTSKNHP
jgi:energy-coupling factor transporter ATP-binding protein EcfA2